MTWTYAQKTGELSRDGVRLAAGYSGNTTGLNNPAMQDVVGIGPLPRGEYIIGPPHSPPDHLGRDALPLYPRPENDMCGRCGFFIHGDNPLMNHSASAGCIILGLPFRKAIIASKDVALFVVSGE